MVALSHRDATAPSGAPWVSSASNQNVLLYPLVVQAGDLDPSHRKACLGRSQKNTFSLFPQTSLNKLLEALGKAEPFFIRCIRSNAEKVRGSRIPRR